MNCQKCGAEFSEGTQFCKKCSSPISPPAGQDMKDGFPFPPTPPTITCTLPPNMARKTISVTLKVLLVMFGVFVLMLILIPRNVGATRKAREASLAANLKLIRESVDSFHMDTGYYPKTLVALTKDCKSIKLSDFQGKLSAIPKKFHGPYLTVQGGVENLPTNPFANASATTADKHWKYKPATGEVRCGWGAARYPERFTLDGKRWDEL